MGGDQFQKGGDWQEKNLSWNPVIIYTVSVHHSIPTNSSSLNTSSFLNSASSLNSSSSLSSSSSQNTASTLNSSSSLSSSSCLSPAVSAMAVLDLLTGRVARNQKEPGGGKLIRDPYDLSACFLRCL